MKRANRKLQVMSLVAAFAAPGLALAQGTLTMTEGERFSRPEVRVLGGISGYTGDLSDVTGAGPMAGIVVEGETPALPLDIEASYQGSRLPVDGIDGEGLWHHNLDALAKVQTEVTENLAPFVGAGVGLAYVNVSEGAEGVFLNDSDFQPMIPVAAGVELAVSDNITAGVRGTYRFIFDEEIASADDNDGMITGSLTLGGRF